MERHCGRKLKHKNNLINENDWKMRSLILNVWGRRLEHEYFLFQSKEGRKTCLQELLTFDEYFANDTDSLNLINLVRTFKYSLQALICLKRVSVYIIYHNYVR